MFESMEAMDLIGVILGVLAASLGLSAMLFVLISLVKGAKRKVK
jgi:hypothetical protein